MPNAELVSRADNIARMKVSLDGAEVDRMYKQLIKEYGKDISIPGFRKGKVPLNVIRQRIGQENVEAAVAEVLKDYALRQALGLLKLDSRAGDTTWHMDPEPQEGQGIEYEFSHPVLPEVKLPDYTQFELKVPVLEITEGMRERYKARLRDRFTEFPQKEGPAGAGEALKFSFTSKFRDDDSEAPFGHPEMTLIIGREGNLPGWDEKLAGKSAGDTLEFDYSMPEDFADSRVAGKDLAIAMEVASVHSVAVPELDAEFVKQHLRLESLEEFEDYIGQSLNHERNQQVMQMKQELALQQLLEGMEVNISEDMVSTELDGMVEENDNQLRQYGASLDAYLKDKGQTIQQFREERTEAAHKRIKIFLAVKRIAEDQHLSASGEDFQRYALMMMQQEGIPPEQFKELLKHQEFVNEASFQIIREKVLRHLASSAKFEEEEVSTAVEAAAEDSASADPAPIPASPTAADEHDSKSEQQD